VTVPVGVEIWAACSPFKSTVSPGPKLSMSIERSRSVIGQKGPDIFKPNVHTHKKAHKKTIKFSFTFSILKNYGFPLLNDVEVVGIGCAN
jgi:hypothetical protein